MMYIVIANSCQMNNLENNEWPKAKVPVKIFCLNQEMRFLRVNLTKGCFSLTLVLRCIKLNFVFASFYNIAKREINQSKRKHHLRWMYVALWIAHWIKMVLDCFASYVCD